MQLKEIMTREVETVAAHATVGDAARKMESTRVGFLPVIQDGEVVGVITDRDITIRTVSRGLDPENTRVADAMSPRIVALPENSEVEDATELMEQRRVRRLVITDAEASLTGVVSLDKLSLYVGRYGMAGDNEFEGEANSETLEFPVGMDPAAQSSDLGETDTAIGSDPSITTEAEIKPRDARDQTDPRTGPRALMQEEKQRGG